MCERREVQVKLVHYDWKHCVARGVALCRKRGELRWLAANGVCVKRQLNCPGDCVCGSAVLRGGKGSCLLMRWIGSLGM